MFRSREPLITLECAPIGPRRAPTPRKAAFILSEPQNVMFVRRVTFGNTLPCLFWHQILFQKGVAAGEFTRGAHNFNARISQILSKMEGFFNSRLIANILKFEIKNF
jgi:hypothetical protein